MHRSNKLFITPGVLLAFILLFLTVCSPAPQSTLAGSITLKAAMAAASSDKVNINFNKWVETVNNELKGQVSIKVLGGPEVIASADQIEALRNRVIDVSCLQSGQSSGVIPEMMLRVICKMDHKAFRESGMLDLINAAANQKANTVFLGTLSSYNQFWLCWNTEVKNPKTDFAGLKLRGVATYNPGIKTLGATAVTIPMSELFTAVDRKMVDGFGQPIVEVEGQGYGKMKMIKWAAYMGLTGGQGEILVNQNAWKSIPSDAQQKVMTITKQYEEAAATFWKQQLDAAWKDLQEQGVKTPNWSAADMAWFQGIWGDGILQDLKAKVSADTIAKYSSIVSKK
jgi:TRAP-type C4-dicarboxylate transport system substrate-binding protein